MSQQEEGQRLPCPAPSACSRPAAALRHSRGKKKKQNPHTHRTTGKVHRNTASCRLLPYGHAGKKIKEQPWDFPALGKKAKHQPRVLRGRALGFLHSPTPQPDPTARPLPRSAPSSPPSSAGRSSSLCWLRAQHPPHQPPAAFCAVSNPRGRRAPARGRPRWCRSLTQNHLRGEQGPGALRYQQSSPSCCPETPRAPCSPSPRVPEAGAPAACPKPPGRQLAARGSAKQARTRLSTKKRAWGGPDSTG